MSDEELREILLTPIRKCAVYKPAFGRERGGGLSLAEFQELYAQDMFYAWLGLDEPIVYAAHKAAGGLTSVYRQLGIGCERLFRQVLTAELGLDRSQLQWDYQYTKTAQTEGTHTLDARILLDHLTPESRERFVGWLQRVGSSLGLDRSKLAKFDGVVFEVRQGYKSADAKRQNADLQFGLNAMKADLLPAFALMSSQVSQVVARRYRGSGMLVLVGTANEDPTVSTFAFFRDVVGYDLAAFFQRNSPEIQKEVTSIVEKLLTPDE